MRSVYQQVLQNLYENGYAKCSVVKFEDGVMVPFIVGLKNFYEFGKHARKIRKEHQDKSFLLVVLRHNDLGDQVYFMHEYRKDFPSVYIATLFEFDTHDYVGTLPFVPIIHNKELRDFTLGFFS